MVSGNVRRNAKATRDAKGKDGYVDGPDEEERLLGGSYDGGAEEDDEGREPGRSPTRVRF